jgi:signal transduction histidine kinase
MLNLMVRPGFCVKNQIITKCNAAAQSLLLREGMEITPMLAIGETEYAEFTGGCLYLTLDIYGVHTGASVTRIGEYDVFILDGEGDQTELQAMALASQKLRKSLTGIMATADRLFPMASQHDDPAVRDQIARMNRGLYDMLRIICNMSDAGGSATAHKLEVLDITAQLEDIFGKARDMVAHAGFTLRFKNLPHCLYSLANAEKLERAVMNILSNAMKFTAPGGTIEAKLLRRGTRLYLSIQDNGEGIPDEIRGSLHRRYLRQPGSEDPRYGIGLGMVLIRSAAAIHGGTVLIDHPGEAGTRITMTLAIRQDTRGNIQSPKYSLLNPDYTGERDHCLVEFSEILPASLYES